MLGTELKCRATAAHPSSSEIATKHSLNSCAISEAVDRAIRRTYPNYVQCCGYIHRMSAGLSLAEYDVILRGSCGGLFCLQVGVTPLDVTRPPASSPACVSSSPGGGRAAPGSRLGPAHVVAQQVSTNDMGSHGRQLPRQARPHMRYAKTRQCVDWITRFWEKFSGKR